MGQKCSKMNWKRYNNQIKIHFPPLCPFFRNFRKKLVFILDILSQRKNFLKGLFWVYASKNPSSFKFQKKSFRKGEKIYSKNFFQIFYLSRDGQIYGNVLILYDYTCPGEIPPIVNLPHGNDYLRHAMVDPTDPHVSLDLDDPGSTPVWSSENAEKQQKIYGSKNIYRSLKNRDFLIFVKPIRT